MSLAGILAPFALGGGVGILLHSSGGFFSESMTASQAALFLGASLSITAFPMLARILQRARPDRHGDRHAGARRRARWAMSRPG